MTKTPEYNIWALAKSRCHNTNDKAYKYYGGRGITVCERWRNSFMAFFSDMGLKPFPKAQIDRINNGGNYEPGNCHWVTQTQNLRNKSNNKLTLKKAIEIRKKYKLGNTSHRKLAAHYKVAKTLITRILCHEIWKETA